MKKILLMIAAAASLTAAAETVAGVDYEDGIFLLNEGAYGMCMDLFISAVAMALWCIALRRWRTATAPSWV